MSGWSILGVDNRWVYDTNASPQVPDYSYSSKEEEYYCKCKVTDDEELQLRVSPPPNRRARQKVCQRVLRKTDVASKYKFFRVPKKEGLEWFKDMPTQGMMQMQMQFKDQQYCGPFYTFHYKYWASQQAYMLTRGWSNFVDEKKLKEGDTITFYRCMDGGVARYIVQVNQKKLKLFGVYIS